jgi:hypothetical protein
MSIEQVNSGDNVDFAKFNEIKDLLDNIYSNVSFQYFNHAGPSSYLYTNVEQDYKISTEYMNDPNRDSCLSFINKYNTLFFAVYDEDHIPRIVDPTGVNEDVTLPVNTPFVLEAFDLTSVDWIRSGVVYQLKQVFYALEVQQGNYLYA